MDRVHSRSFSTDRHFNNVSVAAAAAAAADTGVRNFASLAVVAASERLSVCLYV